MAIGFRPLTRGDLPQVCVWLAEPLVAHWWADDPSPAAVEAEYGPAIDGTDPTEVFVVTVAGRDAGMIQRHRWHDEPAYVTEVSPHLDIPDGAMSVDYLLGTEEARGGGTGTAMLGAFMELLWRDHPACPCVIVPVHAGNRASWRALERNGFTLVAECELEPDNPAHTRDHRVYRLDRPRG